MPIKLRETEVKNKVISIQDHWHLEKEGTSNKPGLLG
jgi:hypothetical protein